MSLNLDIAIFLGFLIANLIFGLISNKNIKTIKEYALGDRNFSTATLAATITATWIGGSFFYGYITECYNNKHFIWIAIGDSICLLLIGVFFIPRMKEFLGKLSIAEAMGDLYGTKVRIITAICSFIGISGIIAVQLKVSAMLFSYLGIDTIWGILLSGLIVTLYSSLGGIKSVTFTDIIQFITFAIVIPLMTFNLLKTTTNAHEILNVQFTAINSYTEVLNPYQLSLMVWCIVPSFNPTYFQRISMAQDIWQAKKSYLIAALCCFIMTLLIAWLGWLMLIKHPNIDSNMIVPVLIDDLSFVPGFKGLMLAGIMAMILSTIDSYINSTAVIITHDFCRPLGIKIFDNQLFFARLLSLLTGFISISMATFNSGTIIESFLFASSFYMPIVSVPFIMAILGFRSSGTPVIIGMVSGLIATIIWDYILKMSKIATSIPIGMLANFIALFISHYLLKQPGGWVGIKNPEPLIWIRQQRYLWWKKCYKNIKSFNILEVLRDNTPKKDGLIVVTGFFIMIITFTSVNSLPKFSQEEYSIFINIIYLFILLSSSALISYPLWLSKWRTNKMIFPIIWNIIVYFILICCSLLITFISKFSELQLMIFLINLIIVLVLTQWQWGLFCITSGTLLTNFLFKYCFTINWSEEKLITSQFEIVYILLSISTVLILFLKPKQEEYILNSDKINYLKNHAQQKNIVLTKALQIKQEFLENLQHESHTPLVGIGTGEILLELYDKLDHEQLKSNLEIVAKSSNRLLTMVNSLIDVSKLSCQKYTLNIEPVELSNLIYDRINFGKRFYMEDKNLWFDLRMPYPVTAKCDKYHITLTIDNMISNAIKYCSDNSTIIVYLTADKDTVEFAVNNKGKPIPKEELYTIFDPFTTGSNTRTAIGNILSGQRGLGLTLCKLVIEAHKGRIEAESDEENGTTFRVTLPLSL